MSFPGDIKVYKNWKSLISDKKINAVFISSPPKTHKEIIKYSIKRKRSIINFGNKDEFKRKYGL